ncbi:hypothetical protein [Tsukamurella pseudospumae]|nr:hypothetical protein [Tsukamurella pseudospumae]
MSGVDELLEDLSLAAADLLRDWEALARACGAKATPTSPCACQAPTFPVRLAKPEVVAQEIATDCVVYVAAASQQLRMLAKLDDTELVLNGWSITRTVVEHCSRVGWLLDRDVSARARLARWYMELIASAQRMRNVAKATGDTALRERAERHRDRIVSDARRVFPDAAVYPGGEPRNWSVDGEKYAGLSKAANNFGRDHLEQRGLYDSLSSFTHPSLDRLAQQTRAAPRGTELFKQFVAAPADIRWQFAIACNSVRSAAQLIAWYLELDATGIDTWGGRHPALRLGAFGFPGRCDG